MSCAWGEARAEFCGDLARVDHSSAAARKLLEAACRLYRNGLHLRNWSSPCTSRPRSVGAIREVRRGRRRLACKSTGPLRGAPAALPIRASRTSTATCLRPFRDNSQRDRVRTHRRPERNTRWRICLGLAAYAVHRASRGPDVARPLNVIASVASSVPPVGVVQRSQVAGSNNSRKPFSAGPDHSSSPLDSGSSSATAATTSGSAAAGASVIGSLIGWMKYSFLDFARSCSSFSSAAAR